MNYYLELFGYLGSLLIILSMMFTSINKLRIINIIGSIISLTYSIIVDAWPIVILNASLITINMYHLIRYYIKKRKLKKFKFFTNN